MPNLIHYNRSLRFFPDEAATVRITPQPSRLRRWLARIMRRPLYCHA